MSTQTRKIQSGHEPDPFHFIMQYPIINPDIMFAKSRQMGKSATQKAMLDKLMNEELERMEKMYGITSVLRGVKKMQTLDDFGRSGEFRLEDVRLALEEYEEQMTLTEQEREDRNEIRDFLKEFDGDDDYTRFFDGTDADDLAKEWCDNNIRDYDQYSFPWGHIDWQAAGEELLQDYPTMDVGGYELYYDRY